MAKITMLSLAALFVSTILLSGCTTAGQVVSSKPLMTCPDCSQQVVTSSIKGLDFTRVVCPKCEKVLVMPEGAYEHRTTAYYCPDCKALTPTVPEYQVSTLPEVVTLNQLLY